MNNNIKIEYKYTKGRKIHLRVICGEDEYKVVVNPVKKVSEIVWGTPIISKEQITLIEQILDLSGSYVAQNGYADEVLNKYKK